MRKLIVFSLLAAVMCVPAMADFTVGDTVTVKKTGVSPRLNVSVDSSGVNATVHAGIYNLKINGIDFDSFCIDVRDASTNNPKSYDVEYLKDTPDPLAGPMGATKAADLSKLLSAYWTSNLTNKQAAALQLAVWEVVDELDSNSYDIDAGQFKATSNPSNVQGLAQDYLNNFVTYTGTIYTYVGLTNDDVVETGNGLGSYQDYVVRIPAPGAILLGSIGTALVGFLKRRRSL